jgi:hypothetical protein
MSPCSILPVQGNEPPRVPSGRRLGDHYLCSCHPAVRESFAVPEKGSVAARHESLGPEWRRKGRAGRSEPPPLR